MVKSGKHTVDRLSWMRMKSPVFVLTTAALLNLSISAECALASAEDEQVKSNSSLPTPKVDLYVDKIVVEGNRIVPEQKIRKLIKTKPGDKFDRELIQNDLKAIHDSGWFDKENLMVMPQLMSTGKVLLKFIIGEATDNSYCATHPGYWHQSAYSFGKSSCVFSVPPSLFSRPKGFWDLQQRLFQSFGVSPRRAWVISSMQAPVKREVLPAQLFLFERDPDSLSNTGTFG